MYLMGGPRQLFFFQYGPEMPKVWKPLIDVIVSFTKGRKMKVRRL